MQKEKTFKQKSLSVCPEGIHISQKRKKEKKSN